ncbi:disintegrin and metalloproteinase domain-containing protein 10-like isoform X2 [Ornithodoros turicata]|uniref:disintegrin and metalloproteinase domain-containing protein 10-like isoform X2 n=1 Tax=Ornithodoros turicata TaxID=34597 RepID=UPI003139E2D5
MSVLIMKPTSSTITALLVFVCFSAVRARRLNRFIRHFEPLLYDHEEVHASHIRAKRSTAAKNNVHIAFRAHNRDFHLRLTADSSIFHEDLVVETATRRVFEADTSHIYTGRVVGDSGSHVYGSLHDGVFEGGIHTRNGSYYAESARKYFEKQMPFKSVIYSATDAEFPRNNKTGSARLCGLYGRTEAWMDNVLRSQSFHKKHGPHNGERRRLKRDTQDPDIRSERIGSVVGDRRDNARTLPLKQWNGNATARRALVSRRVCNMRLSIDHHLYGYFAFLQPDEQHIIKQITALIASHVARANEIYGGTNFGGVQNISFVVQRIVINNTRSCVGGKLNLNPFCSAAVDSTHMLHFSSLENYDDFCLAFTWTFRDFTDGILGLAWIAKPEYGSGGICEKNRMTVDRDPGGDAYREYRMSLNAGILTFLNYNSFVPSIISEVSFAHEIGHTFGSPHDEGRECVPNGWDGNYIMYASATTGTQKNNDQFSPCSNRNISAILLPLFSGESERENCFLKSTGPICGNSIQEGDEDCDCGIDDVDCTDMCCYSRHNAERVRGCRLRQGATCSPTAGSCCSKQCEVLPELTPCKEEDRCSGKAFCDGLNVKCPEAPLKSDMTECNNGTQVCKQGRCTGSVCEKYGLTECTLTGSGLDALHKCQLACRDHGSGDEHCYEACHYPDMKHLCGKMLQPGSPCDDMKGYCDVFQRCRPIDSEGPLSRMHQFLFGQSPILSVRQFVADHIFLSGITLIGSVWTLVLVFRCFALHTPSNNPRKKPAYKLKETIKHVVDTFI